MRVLTMQAPGRRDSSGARLPFDPARPASYLERRPANFGDYVVIDSMLGLVDVDVVGNVQFADAERRDLPEVDHLIVRGSNYIRPNLDLSAMGEIIERLGVPVTVMGIGAQAADYRDLKLSAGTVRALRSLGEHSRVVGTRGVYTADVLKQLGVDNVEPVGCPSFFRARNRDLTITFDPRARDRVAFNMNRNMKGIYGVDSGAINRMQREWFLELKRAFKSVTTYCQGELPEFIGAFRLEEHYGVVREKLVGSGFAIDESDPIIRDVIDAAVCASSIGEWEERIRENDLVIGMRFHGTTVGLSNAVPSIYLVNDTRIHELAAYFGVPYLDLRTLEAQPSIESILELADFGPFNGQYADRFDRFASYLIGNGLPSRIQPGSTPDRSPTYLDSQVRPMTHPRSARSLRAKLPWLGRLIAQRRQGADGGARPPN